MHQAIKQFPMEDGNGDTILGHTSLLPHTHDQWMHNWRLMLKHPRYIGIRVAYVLPILQLTHPDIIKKVLKTNPPKGFLYNTVLRPWLGDSVLLSTGSKWRRNRKLMTPALHGDQLRDHVITINACMSTLIGRLTAICINEQNNEESSNERNTEAIKQALHRYVADTAMQCIFSKTKPAIQQKHDSYNPCDTIKFMFHSLDKIVAKPHYYMDVLFTMTSAGRKAKREIEDIHKYADDIIEQRMRERRGQFGGEEKQNGFGEKRNRGGGLEIKGKADVLDALLAATDENGNGLSHQELRDEVSY